MRKIVTYHGSGDALVWTRERKGLNIDSEVRVPLSHEAIFVKDGKMLDSFTGGGNYLLRETAVGEGHLFAEGDKTVDCRVYYVKKEGTYNIKWATSEPLQIIDPVLKLPVKLNVSGIFGINIINAKQFLSKLLVVTEKVALDEVKSFFRVRMMGYIKDEIVAALAANNINAIELPHKLTFISKYMELKLKYIFESFGVSISNFSLRKAELLTGGEKAPEPVESPEPVKKVESEPIELMYCPDCGVALPPMSVYCFKCGKKL